MQPYPLCAGRPRPHGQELSLVLLNGFHRVEACFRLFRAYMDETKHDWASSAWTIGDTPAERKASFETRQITVEILYLGDTGDDVRINAAIALNHGNASSSPINLADMVTMVSTLRFVWRDVDHVVMLYGQRQSL